MSVSELPPEVEHQLPLGIFPAEEDMSPEELIEAASDILKFVEQYRIEELRAARTGVIHEMGSVVPALSLAAMSVYKSIEEKSPQPLYENLAWVNYVAVGLTSVIFHTLRKNIKMLHRDLARTRSIRRQFEESQDPKILHLAGLHFEGLPGATQQTHEDVARDQYNLKPPRRKITIESISAVRENLRQPSQPAPSKAVFIARNAKHAWHDLLNIYKDRGDVLSCYGKGWTTVREQLKSVFKKNVETDLGMPPVQGVTLVEEKDVTWSANKTDIEKETRRIERAARENQEQLNLTTVAFPIENAFLVWELLGTVGYALTGHPFKAAGHALAFVTAIRPGQVLGARHSEIYASLKSARNQTAKVRQNALTEQQNLENI